MPIARFQMPDGRIARFEVPEGTTPEQAQQIGQDFSTNQPAQEAEFPEVPQSVGLGAAGPQQQPQQGRETSFVNAAGELMSGTNQVLIDIADTLGPDAFNSISAGFGSDVRAPTIRDTSFGRQTAAGFLPEGTLKDVLRGAGTAIPAAVGGVGALRQAATSLPKFAAGTEGVGAGLLRAASSETAGGAAASGAVAGAGAEAGGEIGEAVGGETGRQVGELAGGILAPISAGIISNSVGKLSTAGAKKLLNEAAPTIDGLKQAARGVYKEIDDIGATVNSRSVTRLGSELQQTVRREGFNKKIHPKIAAALDEFDAVRGAGQSLSELDTLRRVAGAAAKSVEPDEARLGSLMVSKIDDHLDDLKLSDFDGAGPKDIGAKFKDARQLWSRAKKAELLDESFEKARNQASGFENGIRTQFRSLLNNKKKMRGFTDSEKAAMKQVVRGGTVENMAKAIGKFGFTDGQTSQMLMGSVGVAGGAALGGTAGAVAVPLIGQVSKRLAQKLTRNNAELTNSIIRAGSSGEKVVKAYLSGVKKGDRSVEDLTQLLMRPDVSLAKLRASEALKNATSGQQKLIADSVFFANAARAAQQEQEQ